MPHLADRQISLEVISVIVKETNRNGYLNVPTGGALSASPKATTDASATGASDATDTMVFGR